MPSPRRRRRRMPICDSRLSVASSVYCVMRAKFGNTRTSSLHRRAFPGSATGAERRAQPQVDGVEACRPRSVTEQPVGELAASGRRRGGRRPAAPRRETPPDGRSRSQPATGPETREAQRHVLPGADRQRVRQLATRDPPTPAAGHGIGDGQCRRQAARADQVAVSAGQDDREPSVSRTRRASEGLLGIGQVEPTTAPVHSSTGNFCGSASRMGP